MPNNRLAYTTSPYLRQHAENPVDWHPWDEEALALARREQRPILLSIGYSACHWCHVMAHESFEDAETAALMNRLFVNIKVDREERPDLDKIYQQAHQLLNQRAGGWPLTIFLTPDRQLPFFSGTYFPPQPRYRLPSFRQILEAVAQAWRERPEVIADTTDQVAEVLARGERSVGEGEPDRRALDKALRGIAAGFDSINGGFGPAPKFPHPQTLRLLLHPEADQQHPRSSEMALFTLERMALGGLRDHLAGGFYRYSVDERWEIPHFEKMLYDNGALLDGYAEAWLATQRPLFAQVASGIARWVMAEMQGENGGYYSSLDADSEGEEGRYYLWTPAEFDALLPAGDHQMLSAALGLDGPPNFEGRWHLNRLRDANAADEESQIQRWAGALLNERRRRIPPGRDDKQLASWNALMIQGMARAARVFGQAEWGESAERALAFVRRELWRDGRLHAVHMTGETRLNAYLDDHVYLLDAIWEVLQWRWNSAHLGWAVELLDRLLTGFAAEDGGFFFTSDDHETLIQRPRPLVDDAQPSGNGIAVLVLLRFGHLLAEPRYLRASEQALGAAWGEVEQFPHAHCSLLRGLLETEQPRPLLITRGEPLGREQLTRWRGILDHFHLPEGAVDLPPALVERRLEGEFSAWLCQGSRCLARIDEPQQLESALDDF